MNNIYIMGMTSSQLREIGKERKEKKEKEREERYCLYINCRK
jgi:hypothetical protein